MTSRMPLIIASYLVFMGFSSKFLKGMDHNSNNKKGKTTTKSARIESNRSAHSGKCTGRAAGETWV